MRVLILTHYFPPIGGPGSNKIQGWIRGLQRAGAVVQVVTPLADPVDPYFESQSAVPDGVEVHTVPIVDIARFARTATQTPLVTDPADADQKPGLAARIRPWLLLPDHRRFASLQLAREAAALVQPGTVVLTTSPYNSTHLAGLQLKRVFGDSMHWVADFRDDWLHPQFFPFPTPVHRAYNKHLEGKVLQAADLVTVISQDLVDRQSARHPGLDIAWQIIPNGIDADRVRQSLQARPISQEKNPEVFRVVYAGTLWDCQHIETAIVQLCKAATAAGKTTEIHFVGRLARPLDLPLLGPDCLVEEHGWVSQPEAIQLQASADLLLMHSGPLPEAMVSKLFDAMALRRPVLWVGLVASRGADLMRAHIQRPLVCNDRDATALYEAAASVITADETAAFAFAGVPEEYDRVEQGALLMQVLQQLQ